VGWYVSSFLVKPNELVREQPYIANNIAMTRQAYSLDGFTQRQFPADILSIPAPAAASTFPACQLALSFSIKTAKRHDYRGAARQKPA